MKIKTVIVTLAATATFGVAKPGVIEVDLIFPRNESYAPTPIFPIVFGFQDPGNASRDLGGLEIGWQLLQYDGSVDLESDTSSNLISVADGVVNPGPGGNSRPIYVSDVIKGLALSEMQWYFVWQPIVNCTGSGNDDQLNTQKTTVHFTTENGAPDHEIVPNNCTHAQSFVMKTTEKTGKEAFHGISNPYCGYDDGPLAPADPCKAAILPAEAKSIEAEATSKACHGEDSIVNCPTSTDEGADTKGSGANILTGSSFMVVVVMMAWAAL